MLVLLSINSWRFILTAGFYCVCVWEEHLSVKSLWSLQDGQIQGRWCTDDDGRPGRAESYGEGSGVFCCPLNLILERQKMKPWPNSSAPWRIWCLHSDMDKNAALKDARRKRAIKALSAKSKPTSSSFEIKPLKYQRILGETQRLSVRRHCWERRGAQLQELYRIHAIWMVLTEHTRRKAASTCVNRLVCCQLIQS